MNFYVLGEGAVALRAHPRADCLMVAKLHRWGMEAAAWTLRDVSGAGMGLMPSVDASLFSHIQYL